MTEQTENHFPAATEQLETSGIISEVPGVDTKDSYVPEVVVNPDHVAIAQELQRRRIKQTEQVSALAVRAAQLDNAASER